MMRNLLGNYVRLSAGVAALFFSVLSAQAQTAPYLLPYTINTIVGGGTAPKIGDACKTQSAAATAADTYGDGCQASSGSVVMYGSYGFDVTVDGQGNIYFTDGSSGSKAMVRKVEARSGIIHVFTGASPHPCSGVGISSYGDGCQANDGLANLSANYTPFASFQGIYAAKNGDIYLGSSQNLIHKVSAATGIMTDVAGYLSGGSASGSYTGDGGLALNAQFNSPTGVAVDAAGNIYIADYSNNVVREVLAATGKVMTIAGVNPGNGSPAPNPSPYIGDGGPATLATLNEPIDVEVDVDGNIFIAELGDRCVRVIYEGGTLIANLIATTNPGVYTAASVEAHPGYIYTIIGNPTKSGSSSSDKLGTGFLPGSPRKMALDSHRNIYISDSGNDIVSYQDVNTGYVRYIAGIKGSKTVAGAGCAVGSPVNPVLGDGCPALQATLFPGTGAIGVGTDASGNIYINDGGDLRIRKVSTNQTFPSVVSGSSITQTLQLHLGAGDTLASVSPVTITSNANGTPDYAATVGACTTNADTTDDCLISVTFTPTTPGTDLATLTVHTTLGATAGFTLSGTGLAPAIAVDPGTPTVVAGSLSTPSGMAQDGAGNTYVADTGNNRIVRYSAGGTATVIAGAGGSGYNDNVTALLATFAGPKGVGVAQNGTVYVADTGNNAVRRIDPTTGIVTTVVGGTVAANCSAAVDTFGDGCPGTQVKLSAPAGVTVDTVGNVYIADTGNSILRELVSNGYVFFVAGGSATVCGNDPYGNGCNPSKTIFKNPTALQIDAQNDLYIADTGNNEIRELVGATGLVQVIAGDGQAGPYGNAGPAAAAQLNGPTGVSADAAGNVYIADTGNHAIRFVNASGNINTVAGILAAQGTGTLNNAASLLLNAPAAVASNSNGRLTVLDSGNGRLLSINRTSSTYAFGSVNLNDSSPSLTLQETNTGSVVATLPAPLFSTVSGNTQYFPLTAAANSGCTPGQNLTMASTCYFTAKFSPTILGVQNGNYSAVATDTAAPAVLAPAITLQFTGTGATLTRTTGATVLTSPATGNPAYGTSFAVTTTITPASGSTAITGTVTFYSDGVQVGAPVTITSTTTSGVTTGKAVGTITGQTQGNHAIVAIYNGDANYQGSTAPSLTVAVAGAVTTTVVTPSATSLLQFQTLNIAASVTSSISSALPTGTVTFYAGSTSIGSAGLVSGVATLVDTTPATTLGLVAGTYNITAVYPGDTNFSGSTSTVATVTVNPDPVAISLLMYTPDGNSTSTDTSTLCAPAGTGVGGFASSATVGTAQGSTTATCVYITPTNTVNDTLTFACSNLPQYSVCTFQPTSLTITPTPGAATTQAVQITLWTDIAPGTLPAHAWLFGWPLLLLSLGGILGMRRRLLHARLLTVLALFGLLVGGSIALNGCSSGQIPSVNLTPTGTYNVTLTVSGAHTPAQTVPIFFTVGAGIPGQQ